MEGFLIPFKKSLPNIFFGTNVQILLSIRTVCPRSSDPFYTIISKFMDEIVPPKNILRYFVSKKFYILYSKLLYKMGQYFLDIWYTINSKLTDQVVHPKIILRKVTKEKG